MIWFLAWFGSIGTVVSILHVTSGWRQRNADS